MSKTTTDLAQLAKDLRYGIFADRDNFGEALRYAYGLIATLPNEKDHITAFTALHVVLNTIANEIDPKE